MEVVSKQINMAKRRVLSDLKEYALNQDILKEKIEWKDLTEFLGIWLEEYTGQAEKLEGKDKLFQLSMLIGNLDIQLDMLRPTKGWQKLADSAADVSLLPEFDALWKTVSDIEP